MTLLFCLLFIYIAGLFLAGVPMGYKSVRIWRKNYPAGGRGGFWGIVLFPFSVIDRDAGKQGEETLMMQMACSGHVFDIEDDTDCQRYIALSAVFWPLRILWNFFTLAVIAAIGAIVGLIFLVSLGLRAFVSRLATKIKI